MSRTATQSPISSTEPPASTRKPLAHLERPDVSFPRAPQSGGPWLDHRLRGGAPMAGDDRKDHWRRLAELASRWARRYASTGEDRQDLAQEAIARAIDRARSGELDPGETTSSQMRSLVRNAFKRQQTVTRQVAGPGPEGDEAERVRDEDPKRAPDYVARWTRREFIIDHCWKTVLSAVEQVIFTMERQGSTSADIGAELVARGLATSATVSAVSPKRTRTRQKMARCVGESMMIRGAA